MPKYWGKQIFTHGRFPEVGQKQKTERKRKKERLNDGNNNGQLRIATPPRVAHTKPPGPKDKCKCKCNVNRWDELNQIKCPKFTISSSFITSHQH